MENWFERLRLTQALQVASLFVAFLILAVFGQRKTWIATEVIMATVCGLAFTAFPKQILAIQTEGTLNDTEIALARIFGVTLMSSGVTWFWTKETRDGTVPITLMMSRVFTSSTFLMAQLFAYFLQNKSNKGKDDKTSLVWSEQMIMMGIVPTSLWLLGNLLHLFRSHDFNTYPQHNIRLNNHLRLDAWFMLLIGATYLAFPSQIVGFILKSPNKVALHVARTIGALTMGEGIISLQAPGFLHERDKKALFLTRIVSELSQACILAALCFFDMVKLNGTACMAVVALPVLINAFVGYFAGGTTIYHVPTPKKNDNKGE